MKVSLYEFGRKIERFSIDDLLNSISNEIQRTHTAEDIQEMQWDKGEDDAGNIIGRYSYMTEILSGGRKKAGEPFDFYDTGAFRRGLYLEATPVYNNIDFQIYSTDDKSGLLQFKYGSRIFGIQPKNMDLFSLKVKEILINQLNNKIK